MLLYTQKNVSWHRLSDKFSNFLEYHVSYPDDCERGTRGGSSIRLLLKCYFESRLNVFLRIYSTFSMHWLLNFKLLLFWDDSFLFDICKLSSETNAYIWLDNIVTSIPLIQISLVYNSEEGKYYLHYQEILRVKFNGK